MVNKLGVLLGLATALIASPAVAKTVTMAVDARSAPWQVATNPKMPFGRNDARRPALLVAMRLLSGTKVRFKASGTTTTVAAGETFGPDGQAAYITGVATGSSGGFFPSRYIPIDAGTTKLNQLIGAFIDADGRVIGAPFAIGSAAEVMIPEGVMAISMGINDDIFADNAGSLQVDISYSEGTVTVE